MGHELVPLETRADAEEFSKDHKGKRILTFEQVTPEIISGVDNGKFEGPWHSLLKSLRRMRVPEFFLPDYDAHFMPGAIIV